MNVNNRISAVRRSKKTMEQIIHTTRILIDNDVNTYEELSKALNNNNCNIVQLLYQRHHQQ
uniref:Uncharacterized protein n=1 Tax=Meloidogyne enterolobii TaxID=390850 RepID=A0A6V7U2D0_MELEN|nr:unnamed protein product [Meloidogyne enterolobii]